MKKRFLRFVAVFATVALFAVSFTTVMAITDGGVPDSNNDYPHVALMVAQDAAGNPMWRCSGTFISPTVYLTAGHCTFGAARAEIWLDQDVESGRPANGYPFTGTVSGVAHTYTEYNDAAFFLADLGVVVLDGGDFVDLPVYGTLPTAGQLDELATRRGRQNTTFDAVGYGLQRINPVFVEDDLVRYVAHPRLIQINVPGFTGDFSLLLSNNASTGGTCFGDSGGPNFVGGTNIIAGVTSFGINGNCAGTGGVFRLDKQPLLNWILGF